MIIDTNTVACCSLNIFIEAVKCCYAPATAGLAGKTKAGVRRDIRSLLLLSHADHFLLMISLICSHQDLQVEQPKLNVGQDVQKRKEVDGVLEAGNVKTGNDQSVNIVIRLLWQEWTKITFQLLSPLLLTFTEWWQTNGGRAIRRRRWR